MKKCTLILYCFAIFALFSCSGKPDQPNVDFNQLEKDYSKWAIYHNEHIHLSLKFTALDISGNEISKGAFLNSLTTGNFIPVEVVSKDNTTYELFKLDHTANSGISRAIKMYAYMATKNFALVGRPVPEFNFTDLNGVVYNNANTKGKTIIFKCWFVRCHACVAEFPVLNEFVQKYKSRKDVLFVSLALDEKDALVKFLSTKTFDYAVIPLQKDLIVNTMKIGSYPTHIIVDKNGIIQTVTNDADEMISAFENRKPSSRSKRQNIKPSLNSDFSTPPPPPPPSGPPPPPPPPAV